VRLQREEARAARAPRIDANKAGARRWRVAEDRARMYFKAEAERADLKYEELAERPGKFRDRRWRAVEAIMRGAKSTGAGRQHPLTMPLHAINPA